MYAPRPSSRLGGGKKIHPQTDRGGFDMKSPTVKYNMAGFGISYGELGSGLTMNDLQNSNETGLQQFHCILAVANCVVFSYNNNTLLPSVCTQYMQQYITCL